MQPAPSNRPRRTDALLVRHGQTEWSASGRHTGRTDIPLTDYGRRQAAALADMIDLDRKPTVLASPLSRAWETMQIAGLGEQADAVDDLMEWDYGEFEGRTTKDIRREHAGWSIWADGVVGGETIEEVAARADRVIEVIDESDGLTVIFAHGHLLRVLAARWLQLDGRRGSGFVLGTATVSGLGWERDHRAIMRWNDHCHLRSNDPPL